MDFFADSPRHVKRRFWAGEEGIDGLVHAETCGCLKCQIFASQKPKLGITVPENAVADAGGKKVI